MSKFKTSPMEWHERAARAGFLCGVADDHVTEATKAKGMTLEQICKALDHADAALISAQRELTQARAQAGMLRQIME